MKPKKKDQRTSCLYIKYIPANLKSYFKAYCAMRDKTMSDVIIEYMRQTVRDALEKIGKEEEGKAPKSEGAAEGGKPKIRRRRHKTIDRRTIELFEEGPKMLEELLEVLVKDFPGHGADTLRRTTIRRLHGYLEKTYGVKIVKDDNGVYSIK
jgi:hypothetical protein